MDQRKTLPANESFLHLLSEIQQRNELVNLLFDNNGLERASGKIAALKIDNTSPSLTLQDGKEIKIEKLVAVNGIFTDHYTEW